VTSSLLQWLITQANNQFWSRRFLSGLSGGQVAAHWRFELKEQLVRKIFGVSEKAMNAIYERDEKFDSLISKKVAGQRAEIFWGFQGSSRLSLEAAKKSEKTAIVELSGAHVPFVVELLEEERMLHPDWSDSFSHFNFPRSYFERLKEEPHVADMVIGASSYTRSSLMQYGVPESKFRMLPLGFDPAAIKIKDLRKLRKNPLKLLYVGRVTQAKGVKYALEAVKYFDKTEIELHIIGHVQGSGTALKKYNNFVLHPAISQGELFSVYCNYDALILPTISDGFGLVILEAMAAGIPVIATENSAGPDIVEHGKSGFVIPIRSVAAIVQCIEVLKNQTSEQYELMSAEARTTAMKYSWESYAIQVKSLLESL